MSNADYNCCARMHMIYIQSCKIDTQDPTCEASAPIPYKAGKRYFQDEKIFLIYALLVIF